MWVWRSRWEVREVLYKWRRRPWWIWRLVLAKWFDLAWKIALASTVVGGVCGLIGWFVIRSIPEAHRFEALVCLLLFLIFWRLDSIARRK